MKTSFYILKCQWLKLALLGLLLAVYLVGCNAYVSPNGLLGREKEIFRDPLVARLANRAAAGDLESMEKLVRSGVDVNALGEKGMTPAFWAIRRRNLEGFVWLLNHGADVNVGRDPSIIELATAHSDSRYLAAVLTHNPDLRVISKECSGPPLHVAIFHNRIENFEMLIKAGIDLNWPSDYPAIIMACYLARYEYMYMLIKAGADVEMKSSTGLSAGKNWVVYALEHRYIDPDCDGYIQREKVIELLRARGHEVNRPAGEGVRKRPL